MYFMNIVAFNGSPRRNGNTTILIKELCRGASENGATIHYMYADDVNIKYCSGCLKCNLIKRCALRGDDWKEISSLILNADVLVFGSPVYFHHLSAQLKKILDRFRSFIHVKITEKGLYHTPWHNWQKQ